jgi:tetraacyldisaccharide 4'-kinase
MIFSEKYFRELVEGKRRRMADRLLLSVLTLLSFPYALALRLREKAYASGVFRSYRLPKPVVAVGNITTGGTGKTPMTAYLARWFIDRGKRVVVLSRGYGRPNEKEIRIVADGDTVFLSPEEAGDEPYLLATSQPGLQVVVGADRYRAGCLALKQFNADIFIVDDGFQHLRLKRDLNILLLDCGKPFGNGRTLPAGTLREPVSAANRADLVLFTRCNGHDPAQATGKPWCAASHQLTGAFPLAGGEPVPFRSLGKSGGLAFAGIAEPASFFESLKREGLNLTATLAFSDHCKYGEHEIATLCSLKDASRADYLITTQKDAVKLQAYRERLGPLFAAGLEMSFIDSRPLEAALEKLL